MAVTVSQATYDQFVSMHQNNVDAINGYLQDTLDQAQANLDATIVSRDDLADIIADLEVE